MMQPKSLKIAVIGSEDQVALMQLAGVGEYRVIEDNHNIREEVRGALKGFGKDPSIGIILIPEDWTFYVDDLVKYIRERKTTTPAIVEIPCKSGSKIEDVREFYKSYTKRLLGFSIEI